MSTVEEAGLAAIHLAVLRGDRDALLTELATKGAHRAKTTAMVTSHPPKRDNRVFRPGSGFFFPPEPLEAIGANRAFDKGASPLHLAVAIGDLDAVEALFAHKARASKDGVGATLLHLAAIGSHLSVVERLLEGKVDVNAPTKTRKSIVFYDTGTTPLMAALESGNADIVRLLLARGADPHMRTKAGCSCAIFAARGGSVAALQLVLDAGVSVTEPPEHSNFPLVAAVEGGHVALVERLLELGAPSETHAGYQAPLRTAIERNDLVIRQALLDGGARPLPDHGIESAIRGNDVMYLRDYLDRGGDVDASGSGAHLWLASALGLLPIVALLLDRGANVHASKGHKSALHVALSNNVPDDVVEALLAVSPDCSVVDEQGNSALMCMRGRGNPQYYQRVARLLELGANPHTTNRSGRSAITWAKESGDERLLAMFRGVSTATAADHAWQTVAVSAVLRDTPEAYAWKQVHAALWDELVPPSGDAPSVQGELIRCIARLTDEAYRNGNINWGAMHIGFVDYLEATLLDGTFSDDVQQELRGLIRQLRHHRRPDLSGDGSPHYRVNEAVVAWCMAHRDLVER